MHRSLSRAHTSWHGDRRTRQLESAIDASPAVRSLCEPAREAESDALQEPGFGSQFLRQRLAAVGAINGRGRVSGCAGGSVPRRAVRPSGHTDWRARPQGRQRNGGLASQGAADVSRQLIGIGLGHVEVQRADPGRLVARAVGFHAHVTVGRGRRASPSKVMRRLPARRLRQQAVPRPCSAVPACASSGGVPFAAGFSGPRWPSSRGRGDPAGPVVVGRGSTLPCVPGGNCVSGTRRRRVRRSARHLALPLPAGRSAAVPRR